MSNEDKADKPHITNFIRKIIDEDIANGKNSGKVVTRFPPEPNGYPHIGHAKAILINFGIAHDYNGTFHLRFDDTNPCNESDEYKTAIKRDVQWLGADWNENQFAASDYFDELYQRAVRLIKAGKAYVCGLSAEQVREYRGTLTEPGKNSPDRDRSVEENLDLFERMKNGEFEDGSYQLRAKIDMSSGNINLRDPGIYRIRKVTHHNTGDDWCIYPIYDFAHSISDAIEGITHSLCSLEFQDHRPLYNWFVENCEMEHQPQQIEFSRLNLNYTITSKRKLKALVEGGHVTGWDDPRMPTLSGCRRRGYTPASIQHFVAQLGVSKQDSITDMALLEEALRNDLNPSVERRMAVVKPLKVVLTNYPENQVETLNLSNHPQNPDMGKREVPFGRTIYIEQDDFMLDPPAKFYRLGPGKSARLINAYVIQCNEVIQDENGNVTELRCTYLPETLGGKKPEDGRKVKGFIHWLSAEHAVPAEMRLYDRLFSVENPAAEDDFIAHLNPNSLEVSQGFVEPCLAQAETAESFQFNRLGYFCADSEDHSTEKPVFNRSVSLRGS